MPSDSSDQTLKSYKTIRVENAFSECMYNGEDFSQAAIDDAKGDAKHVIVGIGHLGDLRCYVDQDADTIRQSFAERGEDIADYDVKIIAFNNHFPAYDLGE